MLRQPIFSTLALSILLLGSLSAQVKAPAVPTKEGVAAGTLTFGKSTVKLAYAYAAGPEDRGGPVYRIILTDRAVPADALAIELKWGGGQKLMRAGKIDGVLLNVDDSGFVRAVVPFIDTARGSQLLSSAGRLPAFNVRGGVMTGQAMFDKAQGQGWTLEASWHAKAVAPK